MQQESHSKPILIKILWLITFLALFEMFIDTFVFNTYAISLFFLPVALCLANLDWALSSKNKTRFDLVIIIITSVVWALFILFFSLSIRRIPTWLDANTHATVGTLLHQIWAILGICIILLLVFWRIDYKGELTKSLLVGAAGGAFIAFFLVYPLYTLGLEKFAKGFYFIGTLQSISILILFLLALIVILLIGPLASAWTKVATRGDKFTVGLLSGIASGIMFFGLLGASMAEFAAASPLYGVAVSRFGYSEDEWLLKLANSINWVFPITIFAFWGCVILFGLLVGFIATIFPGSKKLNVRLKIDVSVWPITLLVTAFPLLMFLLVTNTAIYGLLGEQTYKVYVDNGFTPIWHPNWNIQLIFQQLLWATIILQIGGIIWLFRLSPASPIKIIGSSLGQAAVIVSFFIILLFYFINPGFFNNFSPQIFLTILLLIFSIRTLRRKPQTGVLATEGFQLPPTRLSWITASAAGGLIASIFAHQTISIALSMVLIDVVMLDELDNFLAEPPGLLWLEEILYSHFTMQPLAFIGILMIGIAIGGGVGWLISIFAPKR